MPSFDGGVDEPFDAPFDEGMEPPMMDMEGVMANDVGRSQESQHEDASQSQAKPSRAAANRKAKRKMVLDETIQLSTEQIRAQLADTSAITRNPALDGDADAPGGARHDGADSIFGPPTLPFLPAAAATMPFFFQPPGKDGARDKRPRPAAGDADADAPEAWRASLPGDDAEAAVEPPSARKSPRAGKSPSGAPEFAEFGGDFDEPFMEDEMLGAEQPPRDDEPLPADEEVPLPPMPDDGEPLPAGFATTTELPDVDTGYGEEAAAGARDGSQSHSQGNTDPDAWNPRTRKMYAMLSAAFAESKGEALSYFAMIAKTRPGPEKKRVVAGCFQELLFLCTHGIIDLKQKKPYTDIIISQTELFEKAAAEQ